MSGGGADCGSETGLVAGMRVSLFPSQAAAKYWRHYWHTNLRRSFTAQQRTDYTATVVIARMPPGGRDTALEQQAPRSVVKKSLTRSERTEAFGHNCVGVFEYANCWDRARRSPEIGS